MKKRTPLRVRAGSVARRLSFVAFISSVLVGGHTFAKTAACPCSPCKCSPCSCGGGGKHHGKDHEHVGVGLGVNVDLGGVGQRKAEPNPFATSNGPSAPKTQEKTAKKRSQESAGATFEKIELTTEKAKDLPK